MAVRISVIISFRKVKVELLTARIARHENLKIVYIRGRFIHVLHAEPQVSLRNVPLAFWVVFSFVFYDGKLLEGFASLRVECHNATGAVAGVEQEGRNPTAMQKSGNLFFARPSLYEFIHSRLRKGERKRVGLQSPSLTFGKCGLKGGDAVE